MSVSCVCIHVHIGGGNRGAPGAVPPLFVNSLICDVRDNVVTELCAPPFLNTFLHLWYMYITGYGSSLYIGTAMVFVFSPYIEIHFLLSVSS